MDMTSTSEDAALLLLAFLCVFVAAATYRYVRNRILHSPEEEVGGYAFAAAINFVFTITATE